MTQTLPVLWPSCPVHVEDRHVVMPESWMSYGRIVGAARNYNAKHVHRKKGARSGKLTQEQMHMVGAQGELALHFWLYGRGFVPSVNTYHDEPDIRIGDKWGEVRTRVMRGNETWPLELKVTPDEPDDAVCVLVIFDQSADVSSPGEGAFEVMGWVEAGWAKENVKLKDVGGYGRPQHFVAHKHLRDPEHLRRLG